MRLPVGRPDWGSRGETMPALMLVLIFMPTNLPARPRAAYHPNG
jgi:hypothetical protein